MFFIRVFTIIFTIACLTPCFNVLGGEHASTGSGATLEQHFPRPLDGYDDSKIKTIGGKLKKRIKVEPFNVFATLIFLIAIMHTFLSSKLLAIAHRWEKIHAEKIAAKEAPQGSVHHGAEALHFVGEVETVFGIWAIVLLLVIFVFFDWNTAVHYVTDSVNFTEAFFIIVIMTLASSRPVLKLSEGIMACIAKAVGGSITAWWFTILTLGPLLGSFITEPAAMTIAALLLIKKFYVLEPSSKLKYSTIALLFVNVSIGGTLTNFAAPPILMVAGPWDWGLVHMLTNFGWKAILGIVIVNCIYYLIFRSEFRALESKFEELNLEEKILVNYLDRLEMESTWDAAISENYRELHIKEKLKKEVDTAVSVMRERLLPMYIDQITAKGVDGELAERLFERRFNEIKLFRLRRELPIVLSTAQRASFKDPDWDNRGDPVPIWVTLVHLAFMVWTILNAHYPALFVPGLLFYLSFAQVTSPYQNNINLKSPLLVGFFLGGLVIHGGVQGWWIEPVLGSLAEVPLMLTATCLTAFNDNAAITYLSTLVPGLTDGMKYAVVAGAVTGGGLTVIANAPNPAGLSILKGSFQNGVSPSKLLLAALGPSMVVGLIFLIL